MGTTPLDLAVVLAVEVCTLYTAWVWPGRRALIWATVAGAAGALSLAGVRAAALDGPPRAAEMTLGFAAAFAAAVHRVHTRPPS